MALCISFCVAIGTLHHAAGRHTPTCTVRAKQSAKSVMVTVLAMDMLVLDFFERRRAYVNHL